eukprot:gene20920-22974_t
MVEITEANPYAFTVAKQVTLPDHVYLIIDVGHQDNTTLTETIKGDDISVISAKFWKSIPAEHRPLLREGTWASINTISGENIQSLCSVTFLLRLLENHYILDALVVDVSGYGAIIGLDFLIENHAVLDLGLWQLTIQETEYNCTPPSIDPLAEMPYFVEELESAINVTSATAVETITLAPLLETDVFLRLPESVPLNSEGILEPLSSLLQTCKISGLNTWVTAPDDRIVSFRAINLTDRPTNIYPSQRLASFHTARLKPYSNVISCQSRPEFTVVEDFIVAHFVKQHFIPSSLGRTISALGTGGSKLLDAAGRSVNTALHGIGDAGVKVATGMTLSAGSLIEKGGHAIRDVEHGTASLFHSIFGSIGGAILWGVVVLVIAYLLYSQFVSHCTSCEQRASPQGSSNIELHELPPCERCIQDSNV